jgi:hypothetical protein
MDWFTILIILLFIVFPLIQQMLGARKRGDAPLPHEEMEDSPEAYGEYEPSRGDEPIGLPEGWQWEWEPEKSEEEKIAPSPIESQRAPPPASRMPQHVPRERAPGSASPGRMPEHVPRERAPGSASPGRMPEHVPRERAPGSASPGRMPEHIPRQRTPEPVVTGRAPQQTSRMPEHIPRQRAPESASPGRMPQHIPRPQSPEPAKVRGVAEASPVVVSLETLEPIWARERPARPARPITKERARPSAQIEPLSQLLRGKKELRRAILLAEVIGPPRALRSMAETERIPNAPL